jgi:hypothetical protein
VLKRGIALCVVFVLAAGSTEAQQPAGAAAATGTATIRGRVAAPTGAPIRGADVRLSGVALRNVESGEDGRFEITGLPTGRYTLQAIKVGFGIANSSPINIDPGRSFTVTDGQTVTRDITLQRGGVITGRIVDEAGDPVTGLEIRVERYVYGPAGRQLASGTSGLTTPFNLRTNDRGEFRIFGLAAGEYIVSVRAQQFGAALTRGTAGSRDRTEGFPPTFYPGTTRQTEAQAVRVRAGEEVAADFAVAAGRMLRVSGRAMNSRGTPATGLNVYLGVETSNSSGQIDGGPVGPDGSFSMGNVPAGSYTLRIRQAGATGPGTEVASMPIALSTEDLSGIEVVTQAGANIAGRVEWDGTSPRPTGIVRISTRSALGTTGLLGGETTISYLDLQNGTVREDDTWDLGGIVGTVLFSTSPTAPWTVKAVMLNGKEITDIGMDAWSLGGEARVVIVMTDKTTDVSGTARGADSRPLSSYSVVVLPQQPVAGTAASRYTRFLRSDDAGAFTLRGLPPGDYVASAGEAFEPGSEWDPAVQKRVRAAGHRFTLVDGQTTTLTLDVLR